MASTPAEFLSVLLPLLLLFEHCALADHNFPEFSPAPALFPGGRASPLFKATSISLPPSSSSPLADPSPDLAPRHPLSPPLPVPSPSPAAEPASSTVLTPSFDLIQADDESDLQSIVGENENSSDDGSRWMSGGSKAVVAIAAVAGVALVGMGALVYKKRQENIQRARYGYATRRDLL